MSTVWQDLIGNLAVVVVFISTWTNAQYWIEGRRRQVRLLIFAVWMGLGAIGSMLLAVQLQPGIFFDLRATLVAISAFLGGPIAALITAGIAASYRLAVGGGGAWAGVAAISIAAAAGLGAKLLLDRRMPRPWAMLALGAGAGIAGLSGMLFLAPEARSTALAALGIPSLLLNLVATMAGTYAIGRADRQRNEQLILRTALIQAPDYLYVKDLHGKFVAVNANVAKHNGFARPEEMIGRSDYDLSPLDRARSLFLSEQEVMRGAQPLIELEEKIDGEAGGKWYVTTTSPIKDAEGVILGLVGVTRDVTRYRQLESDLRRNQELLSRAITEMSDGVAMFDPDGRLVFCNERYRMSFPLTAGVRKPGADLRDILREVQRTGEQLGAPQENNEDWIASVMASLRNGGEEQVNLYDGRWLHIRTRPAGDGSALVVVSDATTMKNAETALLGLTEQLKTIAATDSLTGLANRRAFDQSIAVEMSRAKRQSQTLALLMIDVDNFKSFNDLYGHPAGDDCLREVGKCLVRVVRRPGDLAARYGGEEFVLLLPDTDEDGAYFIAEAFRNSLKALAVRHAGSARGIVTASVGIATTGEDPRSADELIARADQALYAAKSAGRDRVMGWSAPLDASRFGLATR